VAAVDQLDAASADALAGMAPGGPRTADSWRHLNLVTVARLIARAALRREESRGGHFRADFPRRDDRNWARHFADVRGW
jgi:L-aspartate oxidase